MTEHFELLEARKNIKQLTKERDFWAGVVDKALELGHDDKTHLALAMLILVPEAPEKPAPKSSTARTTVPEHLPKSSKPEGAHDPATCRNSTAVDDGKAGVPIPLKKLHDKIVPKQGELKNWRTCKKRFNDDDLECKGCPEFSECYKMHG
jgi:hypothetical protein